MVCEVYAFPLKDESEEVEYAVSILHDISERQQIEEALRESEERFWTIFEAAIDTIFIKDSNLQYTHVNPAMAELFNMPASGIIGKTDIELFDEAPIGYHEIEVQGNITRVNFIELMMLGYSRE